MKKIIIPIAAFFVIIAIIVFSRARKTAQTANMLDFGTPDFKFNIQLSDIVTILTSLSAPASLSIPVNNYSKNNFTVNQLLAEIYTPSGVLLASQDKPLENAIIIKPNEQTNINLDYTINFAGIVDMVAARRKVESDRTLLRQILREYFTKGEIGETVIIKGFIIPAELKGIKINLNEEVEF